MDTGPAGRGIAQPVTRKPGLQRALETNRASNGSLKLEIMAHLAKTASSEMHPATGRAIRNFLRYFDFEGAHSRVAH